MRCALAAVVSSSLASISEELDRLERRTVLPWPGWAFRWSDREIGLLSSAASLGEDGTTRAAAGRLFTTSGGAVVTDGTVDDPALWIERLGARWPIDPQAGPAEIVWWAHAEWGDGCGAKLDGELSFLLWDARRRRLVAWRDLLGCRELFFRHNEGATWIGSQLRQVTGDDLGPEHLDFEYIADLIAHGRPVGPRTTFLSVKALPAGHTLVLDADGSLEISRRATIEPAAVVCASDDEWLEAFRERFEIAVSRCVDGGGTVWAELSGGLDSSSIVSVWAAREGGRRPSTVSLVWPETPRSDERAWAALVAKQWGVETRFLPADGRFFERPEDGARLRNHPHYGLLCHSMFELEARTLREAGVERLLSGSRAEAVVLQENQQPFHLAGLLRRGRVPTLIRTARDYADANNASVFGLLSCYALRPTFFPDRRPRCWNQARVRQPWVGTDFARRFDLVQRMESRPVERRFNSSARQFQYELLRESEQAVVRGVLEWSTEMRHPFLDRSLVELCLAIPWTSKVRPGRDKRLLRDGLRAFLPEALAERSGWTSPTAAASRTLVERWPSIGPDLSDPLLAELGIVDRRRWREALGRIRVGAMADFAQFTTFMALEYWLRSCLGPEAVP